MNQHVNRAVPTYIFNSNSNLAENNFRARPLKQWRKQLSSSNISRSLGNSNASMCMPMDQPGGTIPTSASTCTNSTCFNATLLEEEIIKNPSACASCEPIKPIIKMSDTSYTDNKAYMQSRCVTYDQKRAYNPAPNVTYFSTAGIPIEPSPATNGTQIRETNNCYMPLTQPTNQGNNSHSRCNTTIYKPSNSQFAQQGGVSSGSRISRLKYNTMNGYGAAYNSAAGAVRINSGYYQTEPSPSYYNKLKPQKVVYPYITGTKSYCPTEALC